MGSCDGWPSVACSERLAAVLLFAVGPHIGGNVAGILGAAELQFIMLSAIVLHEQVGLAMGEGVMIVHCFGVALLIRQETRALAIAKKTSFCDVMV